MSRRMPGTGPTRRMVLAVRSVKVVVTTAVTGAAMVLTLGGALASPAEAPVGADTSTRLTEQSHVHSSCAGAGGQAVVVTARGETRTVPFEKAWAIYRGERPGTLIAVCPD